jgi:multiple sugar transport system substrate-binding protein
MLKNKLWTKLVIVALLFVVAFSGVGCSGKTTTPPTGGNPDKPFEGTTIRVLMTNNPHWNAQIARARDGFTAATGINVEFENVPWGDLITTISTEGIAGAGYYDLVWFMDAWAPGLNHALLPLDDYVARDNFDLSVWPKAYVDAARFDGKLLGFPTRAHPQLFFYRTDVFEDLGIAPPTTWAEVEAAGLKIQAETDLAGLAAYYGVGNEGQNMWNWLVFLWENGSDIFDKDLRPTFNSPKGIEATQRYVDLMLKHGITAPGSAGYVEPEAINSFARGESAMWLGWWWAYASFNNSAQADPSVIGNVGFMAPPTWEGRGSASPILAVPMGITVSSKNKDAAWEYLKWVNSQEFEMGIVMDTYKGTAAPEHQNIVITQWANLKNDELNEMSEGLHELAAASLEGAIALPKLIEWPEVVEVISIAISEIAGGAPVQATMDKAAGSVDEIMKRAGYYK